MTEDPGNWRAWQKQIIGELGVPENFDVDIERERRIGFLCDYLVSQGLRTFVLGISGGVDSSAAGRLAQLSVERLRARGYEAHFAATASSVTRTMRDSRSTSYVRTIRSR